VKQLAKDRRPRLLLAVACVLVVFTVALLAFAATPAVAWTAGVALLVATATTGWRLRLAAVEMATLRARIERQRNRLIQTAAAQARFVGTIAHEIKTPLTIVLNHAELLQRCSDDPVAVRAHGKILADYTLHYSDLVDGFLRLGGPSSTADTSDLQVVHVPDLALEAVRRSQSIARSRGVNVVLMLPDPGTDKTALEVRGNQALLGAMLESLVRHAVLASPRGSSVDLGVVSAGDSVQLHVRDHREELATADLESVFDWFVDAEGPVQPPSGGHDGLAISGRIAGHHRGSIAVRNHPGGGCELSVTLPRCVGATQAAVAEPNAPPAAASAAAAATAAERGAP
jgi:signal transduction histidine kinase